MVSAGMPWSAAAWMTCARSRLPSRRPITQRRASHPGQRHRPPRVDADLQRVTISPHRQQPGLQHWSHASQRDRRRRQFRHYGRSNRGRGPRAPKRHGGQPLAPLRAVRPPSPEATCGPEPGDSCQAKLGPAPRGVNTPLWMAMWTTWGKAGASLVDRRERACEVRDGRTRPRLPTRDDPVHSLWTADCWPVGGQEPAEGPPSGGEPPSEPGSSSPGSCLPSEPCRRCRTRAGP